MSPSGQRRPTPVSISGPEKPSVHVIVNRRARVAAPVWRSLQRAVGDLQQKAVGVEVLETESAQACERATESAVRNHCSAIVAVGGDGTLHHVVNGVMKGSKGRRSTTDVGIIPAGTGNDFAQSLGLRPRDAYRILMSAGEGRSTAVDLGRVRFNKTASGTGSSQYFVNFATGGFGASATRSVPSWFKSGYGREAYWANGTWRLLTAPHRKVTLCAGDWQWAGRYLALAVGNGSQTGGGCVLCPEAVPDDGKLDILILPARVRLQRVLAAWVNGPAATLGRLLSLRNPLEHGVIGTLLRYYGNLVVRARVAEVDVRFDRPTQLNLDGEPSGPCSEIHIAAVHRALSFITPYPNTRETVTLPGSAG